MIDTSGVAMEDGWAGARGRDASQPETEMTEAERGDQATFLPRTVGERLRAAREAQGMALPEVASRTRIPLRHLEAIEVSDFSRLPSATYAVGFARGYARAVGVDEVAVAADTREEVANTVRAKPLYEPYEIADPARVPSRTVAVVAAGLALAVLVLAILWFATNVFRGGGASEGTAPPVVASVPAVSPGAATAPAGGGQVRLLATDEVWMRIYDAADKTLYTGTLKPGETYDVPADANGPMINIGRPDKLTVTLNGSRVAPLGTGERAIKDVAIGAAALSARAAGRPAPVPSASPVPTAAPAAAFVPPAFAPRASEGAQTTQPVPAQAPPGVPSPAPSAAATRDP